MPAAAVIPAPRVYIYVVAVKKFVVETLLRRASVSKNSMRRARFISGGAGGVGINFSA